MNQQGTIINMTRGMRDHITGTVIPNIEHEIKELANSRSAPGMDMDEQNNLSSQIYRKEQRARSLKNLIDSPWETPKKKSKTTQPCYAVIGKNKETGERKTYYLINFEIPELRNKHLKDVVIVNTNCDAGKAFLDKKPGAIVKLEVGENTTLISVETIIQPCDAEKMILVNETSSSQNQTAKKEKMVPMPA